MLFIQTLGKESDDQNPFEWANIMMAVVTQSIVGSGPSLGIFIVQAYGF